jgi:adenine phosphoribosyltransferase
LAEDGVVHDDLRKRLIDSFRWIDVGPDSTHLVSDTSGWWRDPAILNDLGPALADLFRADRPTVVVSPEVTGYLLGPLVASSLGTGFVPAVKSEADRLIAEPVTWARAGRDYRGRKLELGVRSRHLGPDDRALVVDDWVSTGAQVKALYDLARTLGAVPVGCAAIVSECSPKDAIKLKLRALVDAESL